jgi:hypothetical protein
MPLIMRCDGTDCENESLAMVDASGRVSPMQSQGWWYVKTQDGSKCACCDKHFAQAMRHPYPDRAA